MAIPSSTFKKSRVIQEFEPSISQTTKLREVYEKAFGVPMGSSARFSDFGGTGKPEYTASGSQGNPPQTQIVISVNISFAGGLTGTAGNAQIRVRRYSSSNYNQNSIQLIAADNVSGSFSGTRTYADDNRDPSTTYFYEVLVYNGYNADGVNLNNWVRFSQATSSPAQLQSPGMVSGYVNKEGSACLLRWNHSGQTAPDFETQVGVDDVSGWAWGGLGNPTSTDNWGSSSNPKEGVYNLSSGQTRVYPHRFRVRAKGDGVITQDSVWSPALYFIKRPVFVELNQNNPETGLVTASWSLPPDYPGNKGGVTINRFEIQWFVNGNPQNPQTINAGSTSASRTYSNGQTADARVRVVTSEGTSFYSNDSDPISVNIQAPLNPPDNLTFDAMFDTGIEVNWLHPDGHQSGDFYRIQISFNNGSTWQEFDLTQSTSASDFNVCGNYNLNGAQSNIAIRGRTERSGNFSDYTIGFGNVSLNCPF